MPIYKNLNTRMLGFSAPQNEQIELALTYGFKGIDLDAVDFSLQVQMRGLDVARRLVDSAKIPLGAFLLPEDLHGDEAAYSAGMQKLPALAQMAKDMKCLRAVTTLRPYSEDRPMPENFEFQTKRLGDIGRILDECGIRLAVNFQASAKAREGKPHEFIHTFDALAKLVGGVGMDNVGLVVDLWQLYVSGEGIAAIESVPVEKIVYVQIASAPSDTPAAELAPEQRLLPAEDGPVGLVPGLQALKAKGYDGPVTPTPAPGVFKGKRRDPIVRAVGEAVHKVFTAAGLTSRAPATVGITTYEPHGEGSSRSSAPTDSSADNSDDTDSDESTNSKPTPEPAGQGS